MAEQIPLPGLPHVTLSRPPESFVLSLQMGKQDQSLGVPASPQDLPLA